MFGKAPTFPLSVLFSWNSQITYFLASLDNCISIEKVYLMLRPEAIHLFSFPVQRKLKVSLSDMHE